VVDASASSTDAFQIELSVSFADQYDLILQSDWMQSFSHQPLRSAPLIPPFLPERFVRVWVFLAPLIVFASFLCNQPQNWAVLVILVFISLLWFCCIIPWIQRPAFQLLLRNSETYYLMALSLLYVTLAVLQGLDRQFLKRWLFRLDLAKKEDLSDADFQFMLAFTLFWFTLISAEWLIVNFFDAIACPYRYWKRFELVVMASVVLMTMYNRTFWRSDVWRFAPSICVMQICDSTYTMSYQVALLRAIFTIKHFLLLWRSPEASIVIRAPISSFAQPSDVVHSLT
jgi:hypothetical protein